MSVEACIRIGVANRVCDIVRQSVSAIATMSSSSKSYSSSGRDSLRGVAKRLVAKTRTMVDVKAAIDVLEDAGLIKDIGAEGTASTLKRSLTQASVDQAKVKTPYGPLIQSVEINAPKIKHWEYISPFAWLYYLSTISPAFADMMRAHTIDGNRLRIVIYSDGPVSYTHLRAHET